jgi:phosphodiesterase/alkaline phosphatase D-like protein
MKFVASFLCSFSLWAAAPPFQSNWPAPLSRPWPGPEYWSNPLQDWRIAGGRLENIAPGGDRNLYLLTRQIERARGTIEMSVRLGQLDAARIKEGFAGFRIGIRGSFNDYRDSAVRGYGMNIGVTGDGRLFIGRITDNAPRIATPVQDVELRFRAAPAAAAYTMSLAAFDSSGKELGQVARDGVNPRWLPGGLALVSHSGHVPETPESDAEEANWADKRYTVRGGDVRFWFKDWKVSGSKLSAHPDRAFGPILFTMHTLNRGVLKLMAQMAPVEMPTDEVQLQVRGRTIARAAIDPMSRTAAFRIPNWNGKVDTPYRVVYKNQRFSGTVRKDPVNKSRIVVAAFTGNNDLGFPHADIVRNVSFHKPDILVYTGDNIYERVGEYGIQREPLETATLDYLRKWYLFGWEYRDLLKDIPSVELPDDHDVYHGNIWGAGGKRAEGQGQPGQDSGGYTMPAEWVNMVQRTQTSHMPDPYDPTPVAQGISVYYGPLLYGGVSFAIVEDRKWKSAPKVILPKAQIINGWPQNPDYDAARHGDVKGAQLLGERQEAFLEKWAHDWSGGAWIKSVISQTIFANLATLPKEMKSDAGTPKLRVLPPGEYAESDVPVMDHDSNGWPQTPRNTALRSMRKALAFHIAGDQHLGSTIQYGIDEWNDAGWAICVPSVANVFPRRWYPPAPGRNPLPHSPRNTGEYHDGFGNKITVHAVSNPHSNGVQPVALFERAPGYGIIAIDRATRRITMANWPRWVDATKPGAKPYEGWPITIHQFDNGMPSAFELDPVKAEIDHPVVQVIDQSTDEPVFTVRIHGREFTPKVARAGAYTVRVFDPDTRYEMVTRNVQARAAR